MVQTLKGAQYYTYNIQIGYAICINKCLCTLGRN